MGIYGKKWMENGSTILRFETRKSQHDRLRYEEELDRSSNRTEAEDETIRRYSRFVIEY